MPALPRATQLGPHPAATPPHPGAPPQGAIDAFASHPAVWPGWQSAKAGPAVIRVSANRTRNERFMNQASSRGDAGRLGSDDRDKWTMRPEPRITCGTSLQVPAPAKYSRFRGGPSSTHARPAGGSLVWGEGGRAGVDARVRNETRSIGKIRKECDRLLGSLTPLLATRYLLPFAFREGDLCGHFFSPSGPTR